MTLHFFKYRGFVTFGRILNIIFNFYNILSEIRIYRFPDTLNQVQRQVYIGNIQVIYLIAL